MNNVEDTTAFDPVFCQIGCIFYDIRYKTLFIIMKLHANVYTLSLFIFISDEVLPKVHDNIKFMGNNYNCDDFHTTNSFGTWCGCPFLACTGGQDCYGTYHCFIKNKNYDFRDMKDEDCDCDHHGK